MEWFWGMIWKCQSRKNKVDASSKYSEYPTEEYQALLIWWIHENPQPILFGHTGLTH